MISTSLFLTLTVATISAARPLNKHHNNLNERQVDYSDPAHCPGGSIGDADSCTFEATTIYDTEIYRWTQYGDWYDNCDPIDTAAITSTVTDSVSTTNSYTETTDVSVGIDSDGFSAGVSESFALGWSTTNTASESQQLIVGAGQAGCINVGTNYVLAEGSLRINYGSAHDGHYIWLQSGLQVYTPDPNVGTTYSANVGNCGDITQPGKGVYYRYDSDYDATVGGSYSTYSYQYEK